MAAVQVVSLPSAQSVPRLTAGMYEKMELSESGVIARDVEQFIEMAQHLQAHAEIRAGLEVCACEEMGALQRH